MSISFQKISERISEDMPERMAKIYQKERQKIAASQTAKLQNALQEVSYISTLFCPYQVDINPMDVAPCLNTSKKEYYDQSPCH